MSAIITKSGEFVTDLLSRELSPEFRYHNLKHTQRVVKSTKEILDASDLEESEKEAVIVAAWFHDTGFTSGAVGHEERGATIARDFLTRLKAGISLISEVERLILATKRHYEPADFKEQVIRDADASHFAKDSYHETAEILREELNLQGRSELSSEAWCNMNIEMFQKEHRYYTPYALEHWEPAKNKNLKALKKEKKTHTAIAKKEALKAKYKTESPDRSVQTLYRVTLKNHLKLSDIADTKANILLSVNAIIISLVLANLFPKLDNPSNSYLLIPTLIFVVCSVVSMVLSILATRPQVSSGTFTDEDIKEKKVNLLFFGNFHKMALNEFEDALEIMSRDKDYIYSSPTKDLYFLGKVLDRKYRLLRITYNIFMFGMVISVIAFGIAFGLYGQSR